MKPLILIWIVFAAACSSTNNGSRSDPSGTSMQGMWSVSATATSPGNLGFQCPQDCGPGTYQVAFVSSPCSVTTPVGTFSVQGPVCFIANNNSGQGSISGTGLPTTMTNTQQGILIGVPSNPVAAGATFNLLFVAGDKNGNFVEGTASGTIGNGSMTGTGSCSSNTPICQGVSGTFSGNHQ
jgi:hypothetical protein